MPNTLSESQVAFYREQGYLFPFDGIEADDAGAMRADLESFEKDAGFSASDITLKGHLCFRRSYDICSHPRILDVVEGLIGPNIMAFAARFWIKPGGDGSYVSWHQDSAYFGLEPNDLVTVWLALTDSTLKNGCLRVLPGSHQGEAHKHKETFHEKDLLTRGQSIENIDDSGAVDLRLEVGQFSCHHERIVHGSLKNETDSARIGLGIFFIPTYVKSTIGRRGALLVRGVDEYGHWDADPVPQSDRDPDIVEQVLAASERYLDSQNSQETEFQA